MISSVREPADRSWSSALERGFRYVEYALQREKKPQQQRLRLELHGTAIWVEHALEHTPCVETDECRPKVVGRTCACTTTALGVQQDHLGAYMRDVRRAHCWTSSSICDMAWLLETAAGTLIRGLHVLPSSHLSCALRCSSCHIVVRAYSRLFSARQACPNSAFFGWGHEAFDDCAAAVRRSHSL